MRVVRLLIPLVASFALISPVEARRSKRRSNPTNIEPASLSNYHLPLQGSETCTAPGACTSALPAPSPDKTLRYLTIARGIDTYTCEGRKSTDSPLFLTQETYIFDAVPLLPYLTNEALLHSIIPKLHDFDYTSLRNSTLTCLGVIKSIKADSVVELFNVDHFVTHVQNVVDAPNEPDINLRWARSLSLDFAWEVYRVATYRGKPSPTCGTFSSAFELDYAAEYWFYHA